MIHASQSLSGKCGLDGMLKTIEDQFARGGRTPKGQRARRAIFRATYAVVSEVGLSASLENIAARAHLTQAALRHHFATRDELLMAFFLVATQALQSRLQEILAGDPASARAKLEQGLAWHLEFMEGVDTAVWLETSAFWLHKGARRQTRDAWYRWLATQYANLIGEIRPEVNRPERQRRAYLMLTLVLGAWVTHGRGSRVDTTADVVQQRKLLVDAAMRIAEA